MPIPVPLPVTSTPFQAPSAKGKPDIAPWIPPPATKEIHDFAKLHEIDLSLLDSPDPLVVKELVQTTKTAIREDGFVFLTNYGISLDQKLHRQFAIAQHMHTHISEQDQERLLWTPESGQFSGYKPPFGWKRAKGRPDGIKHFNFYQQDLEDVNRIPTCIQPFFDEIKAFCLSSPLEYLTESVNRRLLVLLSRALELPDDWLWQHVQAHDRPPLSDGYFRHALFSPMSDDLKETGGGLRMNGHTDYGTTTLLFSVPVSCLQVWGLDEQWRYVAYNPGALVVNLGETLEIVSAGHFKATRHRVYQPPSDQLQLERLSLVLFNAAKGNLKTEVATESPLIKREGPVSYQGVFKEFTKLRSAGLPVPTNKEWREIQVANMREVHDLSHRVEMDGKWYSKRTINGVSVLLPV